MYTMTIGKFLNIQLFMISFAIGIFAVYVFNNNDKRKIIVHPTPENIDQIQYKDESGNCFQFKQTQVSCPEKDIGLHKIPIQ